MNLALGNPSCLCLCLHIADDVARCTSVVGDQLGDISQIPVLLPHPDGRYPQALCHVIQRVDIERTWDSAPDIGPMTICLREGDQFPVPEDWPHDPRVVEVGASLVDVINDEY